MRNRFLDSIPWALTTTTTALLLSLGGCGNSGTRPNPGSETGSLAVTAATTGTDLDADGYGIVVAGVPKGNVGANGTRTVTGLSAGVTPVTLSGVAVNCDADAASKSADVTIGASAAVSFAIGCVLSVGTFEVTTVTDGLVLDPDGYTVAIDGGTPTALGLRESGPAPGISPFTRGAETDPSGLTAVPSCWTCHCQGERMTDGSREAVVERRYRLTGYSDQATEATIRIRSFDRAGRVKRAATGLAIWWGAAIASVFIPVAHFFLVPGFFLFGLFTAARRLRTPDIVVAAHGICPDCGAEQDLDILGPWSESRDVICRECHRSLHLSAP